MCLPCLNLQWLIVRIVQNWILPSPQPHPLPLPIEGGTAVSSPYVLYNFWSSRDLYFLFLLVEKVFLCLLHQGEALSIRLKSVITSPSKPSLLLLPQSGFPLSLCAQRVVRCQLSRGALALCWSTGFLSVLRCRQPGAWLALVLSSALGCSVPCLKQHRGSH